MGLYERYCVMIDSTLKDRNAEFRQTCKTEAKEAFEFILYSIDLDDVERPITYEELLNPKSKVTCLILYLYSMEPPFYADVN